ncbi:acetate kinase [Nakamurella flavida]|uniref:Acetate kinase n=1 Tax=Nakamurella flavida TaxID=363630 RepID=A0A938YNB9_9ACTN|nr:acetate kinase [Nakamurella flavida]MBM9476374.1 acetate kinase [Nakamurella flavida]MDP9779526.1 acetate kinase [Nakamurella flavida]
MTAASTGTPSTALVLVINCGSSSMKYQLVEPVSAEVLAAGLVERIGEEQGRAVHSAGGQDREFTGPIADHGAALGIIADLFAESGRPLDPAGLLAVGHRVVHGGAVFGDPVLVDDHVLGQIRELAALAPLHNPAAATGIERAREAFPGVPQVAVFDTAFFRTLPAAAHTYAIDAQVAAEHQIRRYGFHGTSHQYVSGQVALALGRDITDLDQIVLHLGNGASASAVAGGIAVETSMGLTPLEGLVMGTRSGDVDPGVLFYLARVAGLDTDGLDTLLNRRSGLLGLAGVNDFRDVQTRMDAGNDAARLAFDVYCHRVRKYVGAYLAVLGGADVITFTAGVGENAPAVRAAVLAGLERLGIEIDAERNAVRSKEPRVISTDASTVTVMVVPTNEELAIARATAQLVQQG